MPELKLVQDNDLVTMMLGASGELVKKLQTRLKEWGFDPGAADGEFGKQTLEALQALQRKLGVEPTGELDAVTTQAIESDLASANSMLKQRANSAIVKVEPSASAQGQPQATPTAAPAAAPVPFYRKPIFWLGAAAAFMLLSGSSKSRTIDGVEPEDGELDEAEAEATEPDEEPEAAEPAPKPKRRRPRRRKTGARAKKAAEAGATREDPVPASEMVIDVEPTETHEEPAPPAEQE